MSRLQETWGLRVLALLVALLLWWVFTVEERGDLSERVVQASITYNTPNSLILLTPVSEVAVRLRGPASLIRTLNPFEVTTAIDIAADQLGNFEVPLEAASVETPDGVEAISVEPAVLTLQTDKRSQRLVPVEAVLVGEPAAGAIYTKPEVNPPLVYVIGPEAMVSRLEKVDTTEIDLTSHAITFEETAALRQPNPLIRFEQDSSTVTVRVPMTIPGTESQSQSQSQSLEMEADS